MTHPDNDFRPRSMTAVLRVGGTELRALHTPGHSPGSVCWYAPELGAVFSGDTLFSGGPGATGRSFSDFPTILESISERLGKLPGDTVVYTGHGDNTTHRRRDRALRRMGGARPLTMRREERAARGSGQSNPATERQRPSRIRRFSASNSCWVNAPESRSAVIVFSCSRRTPVPSGLIHGVRVGAGRRRRPATRYGAETLSPRSGPRCPARTWPGTPRPAIRRHSACPKASRGAMNPPT